MGRLTELVLLTSPNHQYQTIAHGREVRSAAPPGDVRLSSPSARCNQTLRIVNPS